MTLDIDDPVEAPEPAGDTVVSGYGDSYREEPAPLRSERPRSIDVQMHQLISDRRQLMYYILWIVDATPDRREQAIRNANECVKRIRERIG